MSEAISVKELNNKTPEQLHNLLAEKREKMRHLRFQISSREVKNNQALKYLKKEIARILTIINQRKERS